MRVLPAIRRRCSRMESEQGSMTILVIGCMAIAVLLVLGTIVATSAQISRLRLLDVVDAAALDAADALDSGAYGSGLGEAVRINDDTVWSSAESFVGARERPSNVMSWRIEPGTGTPDGTTAVVVLSGVVQLPVVGPLLDAVGGSVTITVRGDARAGLVG